VNHPEIIIVPSLFFMIGYIVWVLANAVQRRQRLRLMTEFHTRLIDKLGSVKDFGEFIQTDAGSRFMRDLASEPAVSAPQERILRAAQFGVVLISLGLGVLILSFFSPTWPESGRQGFNTFGVVALSLGVGFVVSAAASYRLAGVLGLLQPHSSTEHVTPRV
jgi:predicted phage tail protein